MEPFLRCAADSLAAWDAKRLGQLAAGGLSFSLRMRGAGRTGIAIEGYLQDEPRWQVWVTDTGLALCARWAEGWRRHDVAIPGLDDGAWHHLVLASGSGRVRVWADGDLAYQAPGEAWFADAAAMTGGIDTLVVGRSAAGERLMGEVFNAAFYNQEPTHEQAMEVMGVSAPKGVPILTNHGGLNYRIPALVTTPTALVLVADRRHNGPGDAPNVIDLVCSRSTDGGVSWSEPFVIAPPYEGGASTDACLVYDPDQLRVWALYSAYAPGHSQPAVLHNEPGARALIQAVWSNDDGHTWSEPTVITPINMPEGIRCLGVSPGAGAVMANGTLVVPAYHEVRGNDGALDFAATVLTSTNHGQDWQVGNPVWADGHASYESTVFEGKPGELVLLARNQHPSGKVLRSTTQDLGNSWDCAEFLDDIPEIFSQPSSTRLPDGRIAFCNPSAMLPYRGWGVIRVSSDRGKTWPTHKTLNADRHGYQSMAVTPDGTLVVAWEQEWESIKITRLPLADLP